MKAKILGMTLLAAGMLAASPAYAWNGINLATYASRHGYPVKTAACQARPEVQVAVMASTDIKVLCPTVSPWFGTGGKACATHSH